MKRFAIVLVVVIGLLILAGCTKKYTFVNSFPPRYPLPDDIRRIGIGWFENKGGPHLANAAANILASEIRHRGAGQFELVTRQHLQNLLEEQHLQMSGLTETTASEYAKLANVDALIFGDVVSEVQTLQQEVPEQRVVDYSTWQTETVYVTRLIRTGSATVNITMTDKKGYILASKSYTASYNSEQDPNVKASFFESAGASATRLPSENKVVEYCINVAVQEFCSEILPYAETTTVKLANDGEYVKEGISLLRDNFLNDAEAMFKKEIAEDPESHQAYYNLGVVYEARGDFLTARDYYEKALRLKSSSTYRDAMQRIDEKIYKAGM